MGEKLTRRAALACLGSGAVATVLGSSAFESVEGGRSVTVDVAGDGESAFLEIVNLRNTVDKKNKATDILRIENNFQEELDLQNVGVDLGPGLTEAIGFENSVGGDGGTTTYSAFCDGNSGGGETEVTVTVDSADGSTVSVQDASYSFHIDKDCPGNGNGGGGGNGGGASGAGFSSVSVGDLPANVGGGDTVTQQFSFSPTDNLNANKGRYIDVFVDQPESNGVKYADSGTGYTTADGSENVYPSPDSGALFRYEVNSQLKKKDTVTVEVTVEQTPGSGTFDVDFERSDRANQLQTAFSIEETEGSTQAFTSVNAANVPPNVSGGDGTEQQFSFTPGERIQSNKNEYVDIDVSDAEGDGVVYGSSGTDYRVVQGSDTVSRDTGSVDSPIRYQVPSDGGNQQIIIAVTLESTDPSGGPYTVEFTRTDNDYSEEPVTDTFSIE